MHLVCSQLFRNDLLLARRLWRWLKPGDVLVVDRAFCDDASACHLVAGKRDFLIRLKQSWRFDLHKGKPLGPGDRRMRWPKPAQRTFAPATSP